MDKYLAEYPKGRSRRRGRSKMQECLDLCESLPPGISKRVGDRSGAAFGAALYCNFVPSCAARCIVDNTSMSFIMRFLFGTVQRGAGKCWIAKNRT